jgi:endonuclease/exonuclease/phosphatase (EEP) superfamily protein YafD
MDELVVSGAPPRRSSRAPRLAALLCWSYLLLLLGLIFYIRVKGDGEWVATILVFSPRWIFAAPVVLLLPLVVYRLCRLPVALLVITALFPLMGLSVGWNRLSGGGSKSVSTTSASPASTGLSELPLRLVTFNLHHTNFGTPALSRFLADSHADVLSFEELPEKPLRSALPADLPHRARYGELLIASRYPIMVRPRVLWWDVAMLYTLNTPVGPVELVGLHLSSPHWAIADSLDGSTGGPDELVQNIANRRNEAQMLRQLIDRSNDQPLIIAGDFNLVPDSALFRENFSKVTDAWDASGLGFGWTYYHQFTMVRIDHIVFNDWVRCQSCRVGPEIVSPHRPLIADLLIRRK